MRLVLLGTWALAAFASVCPSLDLTPQETRTRFQELDRKAQVEFRHAEFAAASEDFRQAACIAPENIRSYYELYESATSTLVAGDFAHARQVLQEADRLRADYPLPLAMMVRASLISGDIANAKTDLATIAHRFPGDGRLHAELAQDLLHQQQSDLALAEALRAGESGTAGARVSLNLAVLENQVGAFADAVRLSKAIEEQAGVSEKERASAAGIAGLSLESLEQLPEAIRHLRLAIGFDPGQEQPYLGLARIYTARQDNQAAMRILLDARKALGDSPKVLLALGSALIAVEQYQDASQILAGLIQSVPGQFEAYPKLAEAYRNMGEPARATEALRRLAQRRPDDPMLQVAIARSLLDEEKIDYSLVLRELASAGKISPDDYDVHYLRGKVFLATGQYSQSVDSLRHAIELRPTEPGAYYQLGLAYRKLGEPDLAKEQFERMEFLKGPPAEIKARE